MEPDWSRERPRRYWDPSWRFLRTIRRCKLAAHGGTLVRARVLRDATAGKAAFGIRNGSIVIG